MSFSHCSLVFIVLTVWFETITYVKMDLFYIQIYKCIVYIQQRSELIFGREDLFVTEINVWEKGGVFEPGKANRLFSPTYATPGER